MIAARCANYRDTAFMKDAVTESLDSLELYSAGCSC